METWKKVYLKLQLLKEPDIKERCYKVAKVLFNIKDTPKEYMKVYNSLVK